MTDTLRNEPPDPRPPEAPASLSLATALDHARRVLLWEQVWPPLVRLAAAIGLFLAASWADLWSVMPPFARPLVLFGFIVLAAYAGAPLLRLRRPNRAAALRRLDAVSGQPHRPVSALDDRLATRRDDPMSRALWEAHRERMLAQSGTLDAGLPSPRMVERDPWALRALVLLLVVATWFMAEGDRGRRILTAFDWSGAASAPPYRIDAWVTPPAYTGRPPLLLSGVRSGEPVSEARGSGPIEVPAGSVVTVRATGLGTLALRTQGGLEDLSGQGDAPAPPAGTIERRFAITGGGELSLHDVGEADLKWSFAAVPDRPPAVSLTRPPNAVGRGALSLAYRLEDDYGVISAEARLRLGDEVQAGRPLYALPVLPLALPQARTRAGTGETVKDLTDLPFAGAKVTLTLHARDDAGNEGRSEPAELVLPQRSFANPVARALVEQRRILALDANRRPQVERALDALAIAPERFTPDPSLYLGLRSAFWRLANARDDDDLRGVADYLWEIAVQVEDGDLADVERELRAAEDALREALERGATDEELKQLTDALRQTLDRFLRELAEDMRRNQGQDAQRATPDRNARILRPQDLQNMIDRLENLARSGSRDAARRMLEELQAMLDSIDRRRSGDMAEGQDGNRDALDELGDMIRNQQQLRDRTWREGREQRERQRRGEADPERSDRLDDLQHDQEALRQKLDNLLDQLQRSRREQGTGEAGESESAEGPEGQAFGRAREAMRDAERRLGGGNADGAVDSQGKALENLRRGAQSLAQNRQGEGQGRMGSRSGPASENDTDPLGRPRAGNRDLDTTSQDRIPDAIDAQRARRVLEELRRRLGEAERPRLELDYLERLLREF
ncbi:TIGR02302 family protein [Blastochloris tepida]|uniref:TIGR02302 family protein n=1 Tax=Blastochloris tepida TaxID=2233851 RepID=A0A348G5D9_9HYPH|nr:TIGR02302 family protein [Blastochloris tepida]BBF94772.1 hypothetical protein BLTE_34570 [Blastochloris tepida]